jgi:lysophospholipase L1-like esterase
MGALKQLWKFGGGLDPDVASRVNILGITDARTIKALNKLIKTFKGFNATQSNFIDFSNPDPKVQAMGILYFCLGDTDTKKAMNFMNPQDLDSAFRISSVGAPSFTKWGFWTPGTSGKYFNTHIKPYSHLKNKDNTLGVYIIQNPTRLMYAANYGDIGCLSNNKYFYIDMKGSASTDAEIGSNAGGGVAMTSDYGDGSNLQVLNGLYSITRNGNVVKGWKKGLVGTTNTADISLTSDLDIEMFLGARNNAGTPTAAEKSMIRFVPIGCAIQDALQLPFYNAVNAFVDTINPLVVFFGASIIEGVGASDAEHRWTSVLSQQLDSFIEWNISLAGTSLQFSDTAHTAYNIRELLIPSKTRSQQYLVIADLGWNDIGINTLYDYAQFESQYTELVNRQIAKGYSPSDIYISNLPRGLNDWIPVSRELWNHFQQAILNVCVNTGVHHIDVYAYMTEHDINNTWNVQTGNVVHLNDTGNAAIAQMWKGILNIHI